MMTVSNGVLLIFCGLGVAQCLFLSAYLLSLKERSQLSNKIFSVLLVVLAVRLAKSMTYIFFELDPVFMNIGYAAHSAVAPLLYLYVCSRYFSEGFSWRLYFHLVPAVVILSLSAVLMEQFWLTSGYVLLLYQMLVYLILAWWTYIQHTRSSGKTHDRWMLSVLGSVSILWIAYYSNFILQLTSYISAPLLFSAMVYYLSFLMFKNSHKIPGGTVSFRKTLPDDELILFRKKIDSSLTESKMFLDPQLTLQKLALNVGIPPYRLSHLINEYYQQSFSDLVNEFRVHEAQRKLSDNQEDNKKIAAIAFESGFNTLSAFNSAFKKITRQTPSQYRKSRT